MKTDFDAFKRHIEKEEKGVLVLCGEEYSIENALSYIKDKYSEYNHETYFPEQAEGAVTSICSRSIFGGGKLIFIFYPEKFASNLRKELLKTLKKSKSFPDIFVVIITEKENLFKKDGNFAVFNFKGVYSRDLEVWIREYVKRRGKRITEEAIYLLRLVFGNDRRAISSFLDVLISGITQEEISIDMIRTRRTREGAVFDMVEGIFSRNLRKAMEAFVISGSENYAYSVLEKDAYSTIIASTGEEKLMEANGIKGYLKKKYSQRSAGFSFEELKGLFLQGVEWDTKVKKGFRPYETGIVCIYNSTKGGRYGNG